MSQLPRPHIPIAVRAQVAERQADAKGFRPDPGLLASQRLRLCLAFLFGEAPAHLDHDPPLGARQKLYHNGNHVAYSPPANDPDRLVYRTDIDHRIKTNVKGEHGQHPDRVLIKKARKFERKKSKWPKQKRKWPSRPFPKRAKP